MRIYSWNILFTNTDFTRVESFIRKHDFDVLCLQEVPTLFLPKLEALGMSMVSCRDFYYGKGGEVHLVILSKEKILEHRVIEFSDEWYRGVPLSGKVFGYLLGWRNPYRGKEALVARIKTNDGSFEVVCTHLSVALVNERIRYKEFTHLVEHAKGAVCICGDFNILEWPHVNLVNWIMGGSVRGLWDVKYERRYFEDMFSQKKLQNPLRGVVTHWFTRSQLDHVLVSDEVSVRVSGKEKSSYGSDHHPVYCDIEVQ